MVGHRGCTSKNREGKPCASMAIHGSGKCYYHTPGNKIQRYLGGDLQPKGGRRSKMEVWRENVENDLEKWIAPYEDAIHPANEPEIRMRASERVLNRHFGTPSQRVEHAGGIGVAIVDLRDVLQNWSEQNP